MLDLQSEEEVRCCLSGTKLVLMKNGVMVVLSVKLCTFLWSLYVYSHGNAYLLIIKIEEKSWTGYYVNFLLEYKPLKIYEGRISYCKDRNGI